MIVPNTMAHLATHVRDALNAGGGSVGNDTLSFFQAAANPTIWAKFKATKYPAAFVEDDNRWLGYNGWCGINVPQGRGAAGLLSIYNQPWTWDRPTGGSTHPFRLGDWRGYNSDAKTPIFQSRMLSTPTYDQGYIYIVADVYNPETPANHLKVSDSSNFSNLRLGARIEAPAGDIWWCTSEQTAGQAAASSGQLKIAFPVPETGGGGNYTVTAFLVNGDYMAPIHGDVPITRTCYSLPAFGNYVTKGTVKVTIGAYNTKFWITHIASSLNGTYTDISNYSYDSPFQCTSDPAEKQYFQVRLAVDASEPTSGRTLQPGNLSFESLNVNGEKITVNPSEITLYDSNKNQITSFYITSNDLNNPNIVYLGMPMFNQNGNNQASSYGQVYTTTPIGTYTQGSTYRAINIPMIEIKGR